MEKLFDLLFMLIIYCAGAGITALMSTSDGLDAYIFPSKDGKDAVFERRNGRRGVFFPPKSAFFFVDSIITVLFLFCTLNWRVDIYASRRGKGIKRRNESTIVNVKNIPFAFLR